MRLRLGAGVVVALLFGLAAWLSISYFTGGTPATAAELSDRAEQEKQALIDSVTEGQVLYIKFEDYGRDRIGLGPSDYPKSVIQESWTTVGLGGAFEKTIGTTRSLDGELIGHSHLEDGVLVYSDLIADAYEEFEVGGYWGSIDTFTSAWGLPNFVDERGFRFVDRGELSGWDTLVYELARPAESTSNVPNGLRRFNRLEFVEDRPILMRQSSYEVEDDGEEVLLRSTALVQYEVLPLGSAPPDIDVALPTRSISELWESEGEQETGEKSGD